MPGLNSRFGKLHGQDQWVGKRYVISIINVYIEI